jgi:tetratricopeptide (TPR) repeat protein/SAM-dependent methyltransferase
MSTGISEIATEADAHHRAGRLAQAASLYRRILDAAPDDPGAIHRLGMIAFQRRDEAEALRMISRAIDLDAGRAEFHHDLGDVLRAQGRAGEAIASYRKALTLDPDFHPSHVSLAGLLQQQRSFADALRHFDRALALDPNGADLHYNAGNALRELGDLDGAAGRYRAAFAQNPKHWPALFNLAHVLQQKGATAEAAAAYRRVVALEPTFAAAHFNLAALYEAEGRVDEAIAGYRAALQSFPASHDAHNNLANLLATRGRADEALAAYGRAIALKPDFAEAHGNLGNLQVALGRNDEALASLRRALALKPSPALKANFARALTGHALTRADADLQPLVVQAMSEPWARPADVAPAAASMLLAEPTIGACIARAAALPEASTLDELLGAEGPAALTGNRLFSTLLTSAPIGDVALERLLTRLRASLWQVDASNPEPPDAIVALAALLARQCHLNDYVFASSAAEDREVDAARAAITVALERDEAIAPLLLARLGCYVPLAVLPHAERLLDRAWPAPVSVMIRQVVAEPHEEARIAAALPAVTPINDATSIRVRQQYEEHPYPHWTKAAPVEVARTFDAWLRAQFPGASFAPLNDRNGAIDVLIAGSGSGQHVVETARRMPNARILALDLSRASLAYAARKAREAGIANVEFAQGDLLGVAATRRTFDVIEAAGVLHHLADPSAGWRSLLAALRPGGFLLAALYGERARQIIVAGRDYATAHGYRAVAADIRRFRQEAIAAPSDSSLRRLVAYRDFHSTSECRDMLFHVEEHRTTIPAIKALLAELGLRFVGFALPPAVAGEYARRYPKDRARTDLDRWHAFESDVPGAFAGMYEFWVQRPAMS